MVDADRPDLTGLAGIPFFKMTGSGNDFVFLDGREERLRALETPEVIRRLCARGTGIGADGVVWLLPPSSKLQAPSFRMRYRNSDGSIADMCGNASLCSVSLSIHLGMAPSDRPFTFESDAGLLRGRRRPDGLPEVTLTPIQGLEPKAKVAPRGDEVRIGYANSGVPHLVVLVPDAAQVDLMKRGQALRTDPAYAPAGANVDFVSRVGDSGPWRMRTYERGVEGETLACGTGAAASAAVIRSWVPGQGEVAVETTSGRLLLVSLHESGGASTPALAGEGRIVFSGEMSDV